MTAPPASGTDHASRRKTLRVEAYGTVDEANSAIGVVLSVADLPPPIARGLTEVSARSIRSGRRIVHPRHRMIEASMVERLETELDGFNEDCRP